MGNLEYAFCVVLAAVSIFSVVLCLTRGKGASHRKLVLFTSLLSVMMLTCFGGEAVLHLLGMGWRCTPFNIMLMLCTVFFIAALWYGMRELVVLKDANPIMAGFGFGSMLLTIFITLLLAFLYFQLASWHDGLTTYNDQTIVYANDQHGGSCSWRYYTHINSLVHGIEITQNGWWGSPPKKIF